MSFLGSWWFFSLILLVFAVSSFLAAATSSLSIYDEFYHLRIIELYSQQWGIRLENSFATEGLGDVEYYGSFLYHYLMSFPYRVISSVFGGAYGLLIAVRVIGITMVTGGLVIWRQALLRIYPSPRVINVAIACVSGLPLLGWVAATINYDNQLFLLVAAWGYAMIRLIQEDGLSVRWWLWMLAWGLLASVTKYVFVPVFAVVTVWLVLRYLRSIWGQARGGVRQGLREANWKAILLPLALFIVGMVLVASRYVANLLRFGSPSPDCADVESTSYCLTYGPWARNFKFAQNHDAWGSSFADAINVFITQWLGAVSGTVTTVGVASPGYGVQTFSGTLIARGVIFFAMIAILFCAIALGGVVKARYRLPLFLAMLTHAVALFSLNYNDQLEYGVLLATSSRYFFPYLIPIVAIAFAGLSRGMDACWGNSRWIKVVVLGIVVAAMTQGAWALTFLGGSTPTWIDPASPIRELVERLQHWADRIIIIGRE